VFDLERVSVEKHRDITWRDALATHLASGRVHAPRPRGRACRHRRRAVAWLSDV